MQIFKTPSGVPDPRSIPDDWASALRWMLAVMDEGDTSMSFIAGCLSYVTKPSGDGQLTDRQERGCAKVFKRLMADYDTFQLDCLNVDGGEHG